MSTPLLRAPATTLTLLAAIIVLAAALRLYALDSRLPHLPEPDDVLVRQALYYDALFHGEGQPGVSLNTQYPSLLGWSLAALPGRLLAAPPPEHGGELQAHLAAASRPYLMGRVLIACLGILIVPATYLLARRFLERTWALCAAALIATSLLHVLYSTQARPHAALATFSVGAVLGSLWLYRSGSWLAHAGAGALAGVSIACLHNGLAVLCPLVGALLLLARREGRVRWGRAALPFLLAGISFALAYPTLIGRAPKLEFQGIDESRTFNLTGHLLTWADFDGSGFAIMPRFLWTYDPVLALLAAFGVLVMVRAALRHGKRGLLGPHYGEALVAACYVVPYVCVFGVYAHTFARFLLPLLPFAALAAVVGLRALCAPVTGRLTTLGARRALAGCACGALLALPAFASARLAWLRAQPDSPSRAAHWVRLHVERGRDVVGRAWLLQLPLFSGESGLKNLPPWSHSVWETYQRVLTPETRAALQYRLIPLCHVSAVAHPRELVSPDDLEDLCVRYGVEFLVVEVPVGSQRLTATAWDVARKLGGEPIWRVDPFDPSRPPEDPDGYSLDDRGLECALDRRFFGPVIEIYRVRGR